MATFNSRELLQQMLKIAVGRDQNEIMHCGVLQNLPIANTRRPMARLACLWLRSGL